MGPTPVALDRDHTLRRVVVGLALLVQPLLGLLEHILDPKTGTDPAAHVAAIAAAPGQRALGIAAGLVAVLLFVPVAWGLTQLLRDRAPGLATAGGGLAIIGAVAYAALHGVDIALLHVIRVVDPGQAVVVIERIQTSAAGGFLLALFLVGMLLGTLLLSIGLALTGVVARPAALLVIAFLVIDAAGAATGTKPLSYLAHTLLIVGSGWIGMQVLRMTDRPLPRAGHPSQPRPASS